MAKVSSLKGLLPGWLTIDEVAGREIPLTIKYAGEAEVGARDDTPGDMKPVLKFVEISKGLVLNKARISQLEELFDDDPLEGKKVVLYVDRVRVNNRSMEMILIKRP